MTELKNMTLSAEEIELIRVFRQCDSDRREYVLYFLRKFCEIGWDGAAHMIQGAMNAKDSFEREQKIKKAISYGRKVHHTYVVLVYICSIISSYLFRIIISYLSDN